MNEKRFARELRRAERLYQLINRKGNGVKVDIFTIELPAPSQNDTPDIDIDPTPEDGYDDDLPADYNDGSEADYE